MAKKKKEEPKEPDDSELEVPDGKKDEEGDEVIDLYEEEDDLENDIEYDLNKINDEMLADESEDEEVGPERDEVIDLLRKVKCAPCSGSSSKRECPVRKDYGCPPEKAKK